MKRVSKMAWLVLAGWPAVTWAQPPAEQAPAAQPPRVVSVTERDKVAIEQAAAQGGGRLMASVETRITSGRPYSAEAVTESLQVLGDGNRISKKSVTRVYRDNDGRTRREQVAADGTVQSITISDPVGGAGYVLNPATKTATQNNLLALRVPSVVTPSGSGTGTGGGGTGGGRARGGTVVTPTATNPEQEARMREIEGARAARVEMAETSQAAAGQMRQVLERAASGGGTTTKEDLGEQNIEGVRALGTRNVTVIPAGSSIGNLNEIKIVSEQWFSPDLEVLVMTKHSDPRVGETIYKLTNIVRAQPDPNLFTVPGDYTVRSPAGRGGRGGGGQ